MLNTLDYQIMQVQLHKASLSGVLLNKQTALDYYLKGMGNLVVQHDQTFKDIAFIHGFIPSDFKVNIYKLDEDTIDLHIEAAHKVLNTEIAKKTDDLKKYQRAERLHVGLSSRLPLSTVITSWRRPSAIFSSTGRAIRYIWSTQNSLSLHSSSLCLLAKRTQGRMSRMMTYDNLFIRINLTKADQSCPNR